MVGGACGGFRGGCLGCSGGGGGGQSSCRGSGLDNVRPNEEMYKKKSAHMNRSQARATLEDGRLMKAKKGIDR